MEGGWGTYRDYLGLDGFLEWYWSIICEKNAGIHDFFASTICSQLFAKVFISDFLLSIGKIGFLAKRPLNEAQLQWSNLHFSGFFTLTRHSGMI